jgi:hypothetical protein
MLLRCEIVPVTELETVNITDQSFEFGACFFYGKYFFCGEGYTEFEIF